MAGKSMGQVDSLSRRVDQVEGIEKNNENQVMLKKEQLEIRVIEKKQQLIKRAEEDIIEKIKKSEARDDEIIKAAEEMKKVEVKVLRNNEQQIEDDLVLKKGKVYMPRDEKLRLEIIQLHYDMPIVGHRGQ